jgi:hypothetical protein
MPKRNKSGRHVLVHRLDNGETVTAFKRGEPEWDTWAGASQHLAMIINCNATQRDPTGYTGDLGIYGQRSTLGDSMVHTIVDDWIVAEESWRPKVHDSMRVKIWLDAGEAWMERG